MAKAKLKVILLRATPDPDEIVALGARLCYAQAKHAAPKNADPADYARATGLEALWGYLYLTGRTQRLIELMNMALSRTEDIWQKRSSR